MQALAPDRVAYVGTASNTLDPGVRLGWIVAPHHLVSDLATAKQHADWGSSVIEQLALAEPFTSGRDDRHIRRRALAIGAVVNVSSTYAAGRPERPALVIGYGTPPDHLYSAALARFRATLVG